MEPVGSVKMWVGEEEEEGGDEWREITTERGRSTGFQLAVYKCKQVMGNHKPAANQAEVLEIPGGREPRLGGGAPSLALDLSLGEDLKGSSLDFVLLFVRFRLLA